MFQIPGGDGFSVLSVEGELEGSLLVLSGVEGDGLAVGGGLGGGPPELGAVEFVGDLLVTGHGEDDGLAVADDVGLEALGLLGGVGVEVALDGGEGFAPLEAVAVVLREADLDVRVEEGDELVGVAFDGAAEFVGEVVLEHGVGDHQAGDCRAHLGHHLRHGCYHLLQYIILFFCFSGFWVV